MIHNLSMGLLFYTLGRRKIYVNQFIRTVGIQLFLHIINFNIKEILVIK